MLEKGCVRKEGRVRWGLLENRGVLEKRDVQGSATRDSASVK